MPKPETKGRACSRKGDWKLAYQGYSENWHLFNLPNLVGPQGVVPSILDAGGIQHGLRAGHVLHVLAVFRRKPLKAVHKNTLDALGGLATLVAWGGSRFEIIMREWQG